MKITIANTETGNLFIQIMCAKGRMFMRKTSVRLEKRKERRKKLKSGESGWGLFIFDVVLELFEYIIMGVVYLIRFAVRLIN
ncbi:hypothetical protein CUU66_13430 [Peribacillus deserti]|uniref:Uncharacterized protein n=2 Tax=Peribacillus deserti TaxID=673318 RepID=A0A2N5M4Y5_9BACI|nr:hypothetical protein CUU66_13430 [Peribacillus deserti]